ncbi:MAG: magnesium protoporphyrin IX methyltransferase [Deltaproteobacteria bacterium]|nr:magnesium protoporphyrin IX methyltransferase [Nannocystaceae bacterium]
MSHAPSYEQRRGELEQYFDRTASKAWEALTSDAPVGRIRATVRAGRERMAQALLGYLGDDLTGLRVLDAGCGTGTLSTRMAERGAHVVAIDISQTLVGLARERAERDQRTRDIEFHVGDMLDPELGEFDWIVALDSMIHYPAQQLYALLVQLSARARIGLAFTFIPRTPLLSIMNVVGKAFPRGNRSPDIRPISERTLREHLGSAPELQAFGVGRSELISSGFYTSQSMELRRR